MKKSPPATFEVHLREPLGGADARRLAQALDLLLSPEDLLFMPLSTTEADGPEGAAGSPGPHPTGAGAPPVQTADVRSRHAFPRV
jgi:hypothetical protein